MIPPAWWTEDLHLFFNGIFYGLCAGRKQLAGVEALACKVFALFDILSRSGGKCKLALGIYVYLCHAERDGLFDLVGGDTRAAVKNEGHVAHFFLYGCKRFKRKAGPVCGVLAVYVAYACGQHGNAQVGYLFALFGVCTFALAYNAVLFAAYGAHFGLKAHALFGA